MSNLFAIATVTETMRSMIQVALPGAGVGGAHVTTLRPDAISGLPPAGVNVFLYQITPNTAWQNADLPTRRADGSIIRRPQAAFDLHYLLTFYGDDATLEQQRLLGATVLQLHALPVLSRDVVRQIQDHVSYLKSSNLADQVDLVRVSPANLSLDDTNKLWMTFPNVDYVLSVAYVAGVVLIESDDPPPAPALPVLRWQAMAVPFSLATIDSVEPEPVELSWSASSPAQITLTGSNLDPTNAVAFTTPGRIEPLLGSIVPGGGGRQLVVELPPGLRPGANTVQLIRNVAGPSASSDAPRVIAQSNAAVFVIRPAIASITTDSPPGRLTVVLSAPIGPRQQASLLLNQLDNPKPRAFALTAAPRPSETVTILFDLAGLPSGSIPFEFLDGERGSIPAGTYLARLRVDGAESRPATDRSSGKFIGPIVVI